MHGATTSTSFGFKVASPATDWTVTFCLDVLLGVAGLEAVATEVAEAARDRLGGA